MWLHSYFCAFSYFVPLPLLCSAHRMSRAQLRNSCWMFCCLLVPYKALCLIYCLLFKSYSEHRIINVLVSIPLAIKVFKKHQWINFHNMSVRWGYIISTFQMESWSRDKIKNDLWLRNSFWLAFGLISFFLIIYHTGCPEQGFISLSANEV